MAQEAKTQWHPAFCATMELICERWKGALEFQAEFQLGTKPNIIDMLIIKKQPDVVLDRAFVENFRAFNILEFKSPDDDLNIDSLAKGIAYACEYKSQGSCVDERAFADMTLTLVRESRPEKLLDQLRGQGVNITNAVPGVYAVEAFPLLFIQIVAYRELVDRDTFLWLQALTRHLSEEDAVRLFNASQDVTGEDAKRHADAVAFVAASENVSTFTRLQKELDMRRIEAFKIIFEDDFKRNRAEGEAKGIISMGRKFGMSDADLVAQLVESLGCTAAEAARMLHPESDGAPLATAI